MHTLSIMHAQLEKETNNLAHKVRVRKSTDDQDRQKQILQKFYSYFPLSVNNPYCISTWLDRN